MSLRDELISVEETAHVLDVSVQHVRRLADRGDLTKVARGLIDHASLDRYIHEQRHGRTRAWAEHTAWGAIALLSGCDAPWLGATQASRVRRSLRELDQPGELVVRVRNRARVHIFNAHMSAFPLLRETIATASLETIGIVDAAASDRVDGYLDTVELENVVRQLALAPVSAGNVTLRSTGFDFDAVSALVTDNPVVAALDAATGSDPRTRGVGERVLADALRTYQ